MPDPQPIPPLSTDLSSLLADRRWIVGLCRKLLSKSGDVDDLVQETMARGLHADALREGTRTRRGRAWLAETARRVVSEQRRSARHRADRELSHARDVQQRSRVIEPPEAIERAEFRERLTRLVMGLPEAEREAIVLRFFESLSYAQMEDATGVQVPALRQRVSRGLARLKADLSVGDDAEGTPWRTLAVGVLEGVPISAAGTAKLGTGKLVAAVLLLLGVGAIAASWIARAAPTEPMEDTAFIGRLLQDAEAELVALPDSGARGERVGGASALDGTAVEVAAAAKPARVEVRIVEDATGAPVASQAWHVIETGDFDLGQRPAGMSFGGPYHPNPEPIASGVTDADGMARFALPAHDLVNLVTERSERFAFSSFPVALADGKAVTREVRLDRGSTMFGKVIDDRGEPVVGAVFSGETYLGEPLLLGTSGDDGAYRLERLASFPRSFKRVYAGGAPTGEIRPASLRSVKMDVWPSMLDFQRRTGGRPYSYGFRERGEELERLITLWRSRTLRGVVVDQAGLPVEGVQVALLYRSPSSKAFVPSSIGSPSRQMRERWDKGARTHANGAFELILKHNDLATSGGSGSGLNSGSELVAVAADGRMSVEPCEPLALGAERDGIRLVLGPSEVTRVHLTDPNGDIRPSSYPWAMTRIVYAADRPSGSDHMQLATEGNRAELALWHRRFFEATPGEAKCVLLVPGYEPVTLDLSGAPPDLEVSLERRPSLPLEVTVTGAGSDSVESLTLRVINATPDISPPTSEDFEGLEDWELRGAILLDVDPGERVHVLAQPGEALYLRVTMNLDYGQVRKHSPVIELAPSESALYATVEAPSWDLAKHPLIKRIYGRLKVDLVSADTGERIVPWSFRAECSGGNFTGKVERSGDRRSFGAHPGLTSLRFEAPGYRSLELGPVEFRDGETVDLGSLSMKPRDGVKVQLYRPFGSPVPGLRTVQIPESELSQLELPIGTLTEIGTGYDGDFLLDRALAGVTKILVTPARAASRIPSQLVPLERGEDGQLHAILHRWQPVRFRLIGLTGTSVFASDSLVVTDALGLVAPVRTNHDRSSTESALHRAELPPGRWVVSPSPSSAVTFDPLAFEILPSAQPGASTLLEIEARSR